MAFDAIIRNGVATANRLTKGLQPRVKIRRWQSGGGYEGESLAAPIYVQAIVDLRLRDHHTSTGQVIATRAHVMILDKIGKEGNVGRIEPIDRRDELTLPDGSTGPIVEVGGPGVDPTTNLPYLVEIWIGASAAGSRT
jgi:hypothetical protein